MHKLFIGSSFSGEIHPSPISEGECLVGVNTLGLQGFIEFLELHLGLKCEHVSLPIQIEAYIQALDAVKINAFYEKSLAVDPYAVGKDLYDKRVELIESGFQFEKAKDLPCRLEDLSNVEELFKLKHSLADRALKVRLFLESTSRLPEMSLTLIKPRSDFPYLYQTIFNLLTAKKISVQENTVAQAKGRIKCIRVKNEFEASMVVKQLVTSYPNAITYLRSDSELIDHYNKIDGHASLGINVSSRARPVLQLVYLISEFLWAPLDPCRIIEFLNLPIKPLNGKLSSRLANALSEAPGFGGKQWRDAIEDYCEIETDVKVKDKNLEHLAFLFDRKRFSTTAPIKDVIALFDFLSRYLQAREFYLESEVVSSITKLFALMSNRCSSLTKLELEKVLENNIPNIDFSERTKELGTVKTISSPENIIAPVDKLIWYPFVNMNPAIELSFWDKSEIEYLIKHDVKLLAPFEKIRSVITGERLLFASVNEEIILVIPETLNGERVSSHSLLNEIKFEFINAEDVLRPLIEKDLHKELPSQRGQWVIKNTALLKPRRGESYSSFEKLFYYPWLYLLDYQVKLSGRSLLSVEDDFRLRGNFSHAMFENFFSIHKKPEQMKNPGEWVDQNFDKYINEYAIIWLQKGKEITLGEMRVQVRQSLVILCQQLVDNDWTVDEVEKKIEQEVFGNNFSGRIDMCLFRGSERCVLDIKYGGSSKYKNMLEQNTDLQLSLYSKMYGEKSYAYTAYFIIANALLFSKEIKAFKNPHNRALPSHCEQYDELWEKMENTHKARRQELEVGKIIVRDALTEGLFVENNVDEDTCLDLKNIEGNKYHDFQVLLGFHRKVK